MNHPQVTLAPLTAEDRSQFILDNQEAFRFGALEEFGARDDHFEEPGEIISRETIEHSLDAEGAQAYRILCGGEIAGGVVLQINPETRHNHLDLLFVSPAAHSRGIGYAAWQAVEELYPETEVWETCTPWFEKRNIHFYINKCGFHAVEFWCTKHADPHDPETGEDEEMAMFRFEKRMGR